MRCQRSGDGRRGVRYIAQRGAAFLCLLGLGNMVMGQGSSESSWDPVKTVCNFANARGIVVKNKLYLDGGVIMDQQNYLFGTDKPYYNSNMIRWQNQHLWELDLSKKFNVSIPPWTAHTKPSDWNQHFNGVSGTQWDIGDGKFYSLGGWMSSSYEGPPPGHRIREPYYTQNTSGFYFQLPDPRIFIYDPTSGNWTSRLERGIHRLSDTGYAQSARNKAGYTFGGLLATEEQTGSAEFFAYSVTGWVSTMSVYDFRTDKFNISELPDDVGTTSRVVMHCLERVGDEGVLIALAGKSNNPEVYRPMDEILVYDIATSKWMNQKATGDIPPGRMNTCSVLVTAPDFSSYQIYVFSGVSEGEIRILDLYVLSVPAFTWTQIDLTGYPDQYGTAEMACGLYEQSQFIIIPGESNVTVSNMTTSDGKIDNYWLECNKGTKIQVFDTYDWEFKPEFDPDNKGARVPSPIVKLVGGNSTGGATLKAPKAGWGDQALGPIFAKLNELPPPDVSPTPGSNTNTTVPTNASSETQKPDEDKTNNTGAIIGGAVGGVCGLLLVGLALFCWKRSRQSQAQSSAELQGEDMRAELHGNTYPGQYNTPHELHAYEPQELSDTGTGFYVPKKEGPEEMVLVDDISPPPHPH